MCHVSCQIQIKLKNRIDCNVFGELAACTSVHGEKSSFSEEEENEGCKDENEQLKDSERGGKRIKEEANLNEEEFELSVLVETEPLMAGKSDGLENKGNLTERKENANLIRDKEKINRSITKRAMDTLSQKNISEDERKALIGKEVSTRGGIDEKQCIPVNNPDITLHTRKISGPSGSAMNLTESKAISKPEEDGDEDLSTRNLLAFSWQVAQGMVSMRNGKNNPESKLQRRTLSNILKHSMSPT